MGVEEPPSDRECVRFMAVHLYPMGANEPSTGGTRSADPLPPDPLPTSSSCSSYCFPSSATHSVALPVTLSVTGKRLSIHRLSVADDLRAVGTDLWSDSVPLWSIESSVTLRERKTRSLWLQSQQRNVSCSTVLRKSPSCWESSHRRGRRPHERFMGLQGESH